MDRIASTKHIVDALDKIIKPLVWYSIIMLLVEIEVGGTDSHQSHWFFLQSERVVACLLTLEYLFRFWRNSGKNYYPVTPFGIIDLVAILPFWVGFCVPAEWLHSIRTLRILRLLKFFRYSRSLQLVALGFWKAWFLVQPLLFTLLIICLFTMTALYEIEGAAQEAFQGLFECSWFVAVTGTTVGYGDISPQTVAGKLVVMAFMIAGLSIFAAMFSAINTAFDEVFADESNPDVDPLLEFRKVWNRRQEISKLDAETGTTDAEDKASETDVEELH
jgi:voltage-gated potassium channel